MLSNNSVDLLQDVHAPLLSHRGVKFFVVVAFIGFSFASIVSISNFCISFQLELLKSCSIKRTIILFFPLSKHRSANSHRLIVGTIKCVIMNILLMYHKHFFQID